MTDEEKIRALEAKVAAAEKLLVGQLEATIAWLFEEGFDATQERQSLADYRKVKVPK